MAIKFKINQTTPTVIDGLNNITLGANESYTCVNEEKLDFIFTVDTTISDNSPSDSYALQFTVSSVNNALIKWGDGTEEYLAPSQANPIIHQYAIGGVYDITISGYLAFRNLYDTLKLIAVKQWGLFVISSMNNTFSNNYNLASVPQNETLMLPSDSRDGFEDIPLSNFGKIISSLAGNLEKFFDNTLFDYNIGDWNVARCGNFTNMFRATSMSQSNCDAILTGWTRWNSTTSTAGITLKSNVSLHMGNTSFTPGSDAEDAFNYLVNTLNWTITFG